MLLFPVQNTSPLQNTWTICIILFSSCTLMQEIYIRKARLTELNIYNDDPTKQLSRERTHNWINLCLCAEDNDSPGVMELAKSTVENTQVDFDLLTCCIGFGILHAKTMVIDGNLAPRPGKCILHTSKEKEGKKGVCHSSVFHHRTSLFTIYLWI